MVLHRGHVIPGPLTHVSPRHRCLSWFCRRFGYRVHVRLGTKPCRWLLHLFMAGAKIGSTINRVNVPYFNVADKLDAWIIPGKYAFGALKMPVQGSPPNILLKQRCLRRAENGQDLIQYSIKVLTPNVYYSNMSLVNGLSRQLLAQHVASKKRQAKHCWLAAWHYDLYWLLIFTLNKINSVYGLFGPGGVGWLGAVPVLVGVTPGGGVDGASAPGWDASL